MYNDGKYMVVFCLDAEEFEQELSRREKSKDLAKKDRRGPPSVPASNNCSSVEGSSNRVTTSLLHLTTPKRSQYSNTSSDLHNDSKSIKEEKSSPDKKYFL